MLVNYEFISAWMSSRIRNERAASLVEYALLVALIAAVCIAAVKLFGQNARGAFTQAANQVTTTVPAP